jgi:hypothetical protein
MISFTSPPSPLSVYREGESESSLDKLLFDWVLKEGIWDEVLNIGMGSKKSMGRQVS